MEISQDGHLKTQDNAHYAHKKCLEILTIGRETVSSYQPVSCCFLFTLENKGEFTPLLIHLIHIYLVSVLLSIELEIAK